MSIELQRIEFRVVVTERDLDGTITEERVIGEGVVYPVGLDALPDRIRGFVASADGSTAPLPAASTK